MVVRLRRKPLGRPRTCDVEVFQIIVNKSAVELDSKLRSYIQRTIKKNAKNVYCNRDSNLGAKTLDLPDRLYSPDTPFYRTLISAIEIGGSQSLFPLRHTEELRIYTTYLIGIQNVGRFHTFYRPRMPLGRVEVQLYSVSRPRH